jgi:hypothetical protein
MLTNEKIKQRLIDLIKHRDCMKETGRKYNSLDATMEWKEDIGEIRGIFYVFRGNTPTPDPTLADVEELFASEDTK